MILAYHGINDQIERKYQHVVYGTRKYNINELRVHHDIFEQQMGYLFKNGYQSVGLEDLIVYHAKTVESPKKHFAITFDDGYRDFFTLARPILNSYGYTATIFLVTDKINESRQNRQFLSWDEIHTLYNEGFSFGAHTCSHPSLTSLSLEEARHEIQESKRVIEEKLNSHVKFFSYPYGDFNSDIQNVVRETSFTGAVVTPHAPGVKESTYSLKRVGINSPNSMWVFKLKIKGVFNWVRDNKMLWPLFIKIKEKIL